jgi:hypothetical protein
LVFTIPIPQANGTVHSETIILASIVGKVAGVLGVCTGALVGALAGTVAGRAENSGSAPLANRPKRL